MTKVGKPRPLDKETALRLYKKGIDDAVKKREIAFLVDLIRTPPRLSEAREHLADVIDGLLTKKISFPNRKPKQDLEAKRLDIASRVWRVAKTERKISRAVEVVPSERKCSLKSVWTAWENYGPTLVLTEHLRKTYDLDGLNGCSFDSVARGKEAWRGGDEHPSKDRSRKLDA